MRENKIKQLINDIYTAYTARDTANLVNAKAIPQLQDTSRAAQKTKATITKS